MIRDILELVALTVGMAGLFVGFYFYYTKEGFRRGVQRALPFLMFFSTTAAAKAKDTKGVFDAHDAFVVMGRLLNHIKATIDDPTNKSFEDVEPEVYAFIRQELDRYKRAGVKNVPDIDSTVLRSQVQLVFEQLKKVLNEDSAGNDQ